MKKQFIELNLPQETALWILSGNHIFMTHTQFLIDRGELEFHDELDEMTESILTLGEKINKLKDKGLQLRLVEAEYRCLIFAIEYIACLLLTEEGETWFKEAYFPFYGMEEVRHVSSEEMQKAYLRFADGFIAQKPKIAAFAKIKQEVSNRMDELFPLES